MNRKLTLAIVFALLAFPAKAQNSCGSIYAAGPNALATSLLPALVRAHLRVTGAAGSVAKTVGEILEVSKGDELLMRRLQTDPGIRQWWMEALVKMIDIELERRIQAGELIREKREDGGTHVRRV